MKDATDLKRYFIHLAFDGTPFHGWQLQRNAKSVQSELNAALKILLREDVETLGCGRTDTGVHALSFYAHFDFPFIENIDELVYKLNAILPNEISIYSIFLVGNSDHARFSATKRTYQYHIHSVKNPFVKNHSWYNQNIHSVDKLNEYVNVLKDYTDFTSFSKSNTQSFTNNCRIIDCYWECKVSAELIFTITADRFLRNMVRAIVGTFIKVSEKNLSEKEFRMILESKNRSEAGFSVPAHGLFLTNVEYPFQVS